MTAPTSNFTGQKNKCPSPHPGGIIQADTMDNIAPIDSALQLPNGSVVPNRLVKAAMEEGIGHRGGCPGPEHRRLYRQWGSGGWGMIITGNVQVDPRHLASPHDRYIPDHSPETIASYALLYSSMISSVPVDQPKPTGLVQLSHPGLQSSSTIGFSRWPWSPAVAPISSRPDMGSSLTGWLIARAVWPVKSRKLGTEEWMEVVDRFTTAARIMHEAGWDGVQIHSAHGYLLAEFLSPLTNPDAISLPGAPSGLDPRLHLLYLILEGISKGTPKQFIKAIKINCSDFAQGGLDESQAEGVVKEIVSWGMVDILEISGGTYANPAFASTGTAKPASSTSKRQSLFAHFTTSLLPHLPSPPQGPAIILTGGLHDRALIASSLNERACDLVGIGRPACLVPDLAREIILNSDLKDEQTELGRYDIPGGEMVKAALGGGWTSSKNPSTSKPGIPLVGAGVSTFWHEWQLSRMGRGAKPDLTMHWIWGGLFVELVWYGILGGGPLGWWVSLTGEKST